jgi:hypothetical protein
LLGSGKVLLTGGSAWSVPEWLGSSELFDPGPGAWTRGPGLTSARTGHGAALLGSGKVLVMGGYGGVPLAGAELFDPATGAWAPAPAMSAPRSTARATTLSDGNVLVTGGSQYEVFVAATGTWRAPRSFVPGVSGYATAPLPAGRLLISGGSSGSSTAATWSYDPAADAFTPAKPMSTPRSGHTATRLSDGRVLVAGGRDSGGGGQLSSAEIYDPATGNWTPTGGLAVARSGHLAALLGDGRVLIATGEGPDSATAGPRSTEIFAPALGTWSDAGPLAGPRVAAAIVRLGDGTVLVTGGVSRNGMAGTERWAPTTTMRVADAIDFGAQRSGTAGASSAVTVTNDGPAPLLLDGVALSGEFALAADGCSGAPLAPGASCAIELRFGPLGAGPREGAMRLLANTTRREHVIALRGTGVLGATPTPTPTAQPPVATPTPNPVPKPGPRIEIAFRSGYSAVGLPRRKACKGRVSLQLRKGKQVLVRRTVKLDKRCRYAVTFSLRRTRVGSARTLTVVARFHGNRYLGATTNRFKVRVPRS